MVTRTPSSDAALRLLGQFQGTIERNSSPRDQAFNHNLGRNVRVIKLLTVMQLLREAGQQLPGAVTCSAALKQNFSSKQRMTILDLPVGPTQAAHFLPGTILIGGVAVWDYIKDSKFKGQVEFLFGEVEHLPTVFNQADSGAEAKDGGAGLCAALAMACRVVSSGPAVAAGNRMPVAWNRWTEAARIGLRTAIAAKAEKGVPPPPQKDKDGNFTLESLNAQDAAGASEANRENAIRILGYYLEDQDQRDWNWVTGPGATAAAEIRSAFRK